MNEFDVVGLYNHNAESYRKVRAAFETSDVVGIVHATGTGKSYNALQLAYDNKDKKIVWVVPTNAIIEHIIKSINDNPNLDMNRDFPNLEFRTYPGLVSMDTDELIDMDIDLLILDEFHHTGAPVWGRVVNSVIDTHPDMKVFGMTAYTVRDRGTSYERDMALDEGDELFSDNIVSRYDLCDAMIDGILPKPIYRSSYIKLIDMASELEQRVQRLAASGRDCSEYIKILNDVKKRLHEAPNMGDVVKKNIKKNGKYIYFCPPAKEDGVNDIETIKKQAMSWFRDIVSEEDIVFYTSYSDMEDSGKSNREAFYDDLDLDGNKVNGKLRVMFAINQYNEGVHAPNIDGVIMGRGTCSDIVFFEQLGRALSVSSGVKKKIELYSTYSIERLRLLCSQNNINYNYDMSKNDLIEKLVAPIIIDLAGNIDFIRDLEDNLKDRLKDLQEKGDGTLIRGVLSDASFDLDTYEVNLFNILMDLKQKTEMTWDDWYKLAEEYYIEHGNLEVSSNYLTENGEKLGGWICNQRCAYDYRDVPIEERTKRIKPLTDERVVKLESIGMVWDVLESNWNKMFELAKVFFTKYHNLNVPKDYLGPNGEKLGIWLNHQKSAYKYRTIPNEEKKKRTKALTDERVQLLESIGIVWDVKDSRWNKMYKLACEYYIQNKNLLIPLRYVTSNGEKLGIWINSQRRAYALRGSVVRKKHENTPLTDAQVSMLESIGMVWDVKDSRWNKMFQAAQKYFEENGDLIVPKNYMTDSGDNLGTWIYNQRTAYMLRDDASKYSNKTYNPLTDEQVSMLESIGMVWDVFDYRWNKMYEIAREYYLQNGDLNVPFGYVTSSGENLFTWISNQKYAYQNRSIEKDKRTLKFKPLTDEQVCKLEEIGMVWGKKTFDSKWLEMYKLAEKYYFEHHHLRIPSTYVTDDGKNLGQWLCSQRVAYQKRFLSKNGKKCNYNSLTDERVLMLESIGMIWAVRNNRSNIEKLCIENNIDIKKNKSVIGHISLTEFRVKLSYLKDNGMSIVDENGILHEIFSMSSMNMKLKYGVSLEDLVNMYGKEKSK